MLFLKTDSSLKYSIKTLTLHQRLYFKNKIFQLASEEEFVNVAIELFYYQAENNLVYKNYLENLGSPSALSLVREGKISKIEEIPFLPISCFKNYQVKIEELPTEKVFTSSGTGKAGFSSHLLHDLNLYENSFFKGFDHFYPKEKDCCFLALLPNYLEREGSSLVYMAQELISRSKDEDSGFYLDDLQGLAKVLEMKKEQRKPFVLLGVTYALLDLAKDFPMDLSNGIIMETGGMKGRRKEMVREEVHQVLKKAFQLNNIHSEYGMTELLSQAYSKGKGKFICPPWMRILVRETTDPFHFRSPGRAGGINIIDLANIDSCAFIETKDLGRRINNEEFEILGRFDNSEIRGCNLMVF